jgi:hypothetical protein
MTQSADPTMEEVINSFAPLVGELVWQARRGHGSFLTMEFGWPHLLVREPISAVHSVSARVRRNLERRAVAIVGDWHFWVQYADWKLVTVSGTLDSSDPASQRAECLNDLEGQRFVSVVSGARTGSCEFRFDLGATLQISPSTEILDDQWSLHGWNGDIVTRRHDGVLVFERADFDRRVFQPLHPG